MKFIIKISKCKSLKPGTDLSVEEIQQIFLLRTRNLQVKCNFQLQHTDRKCVVDQCVGEDSQLHLFFCFFLEDPFAVSDYTLNYTDIFSDNVAKQRIVMQTVMHKFERSCQYLLSPDREYNIVDRRSGGQGGQNGSEGSEGRGIL